MNDTTREEIQESLMSDLGISDNFNSVVNFSVLTWRFRDYYELKNNDKTVEYVDSVYSGSFGRYIWGALDSLYMLDKKRIGYEKMGETDSLMLAGELRGSLKGILAIIREIREDENLNELAQAKGLEDVNNFCDDYESAVKSLIQKIELARLK